MEDTIHSVQQIKTISSPWQNGQPLSNQTILCNPYDIYIAKGQNGQRLLHRVMPKERIWPIALVEQALGNNKREKTETC